jgi:hypothetical protein
MKILTDFNNTQFHPMVIKPCHWTLISWQINLEQELTTNFFETLHPVAAGITLHCTLDRQQAYPNR